MYYQKIVLILLSNDSKIDVEVKIMTTKIVVAGCRTYENYEEAKAFLDEFLTEYKEKTTLIFLSGGCKGADTLGERYALEMGYEIQRYPALWKKYGRAAGPIRNEEMAKNCDIAICFWDGKSKGTASMISLAKKHNKTVIIKEIWE